MTERQNIDWFITDDDCLQCCRPCPEVGPNVFELTQINHVPGSVDGKPNYQVAHGHIYLDEYTKEEEMDVLSAYGYDSRQGMHDDGGPELTDGEYNQLLAEMFFETEIHEFICFNCSSWNEAVDRIQKITGMDLSAFKEKQKSLADQIRSAEQKATERNINDSVSREQER